MDTKAEYRKGYLVSEEMKKVWTVQMTIAKKLLDVCEKNKLAIWADGGTLLGAVRDHGYIPWDDDIDFMMLREDYDKLVSIAKEEFKAPFHFQSGYTEQNYFRGHAQVRYDGTAAILKNDIDQSFHQGIFVDIFVHDFIPDKESISYKLRVLITRYIQDCLRLNMYEKFPQHSISQSIKKIVADITCTIFGKKRLFRFFDGLFRVYTAHNCSKISCPCFIQDLGFIRKVTKDKSWYSSTIPMPFEDMSMPAPIGYDKILTGQYGDYMTPKQAPSIHGGYMIVDTEKSYEEYLKELRAKSENGR